jgi:hypothetical protein
MYSARLFVLVIFFLFYSDYNSQVILTEELRPNVEREKMFFPYLALHHGGPESTLKWKESNTIQYYRELWYYCNSFSVKKDHFNEGGELIESIVDISRFESQRKKTENAIVVLPGLKDVLILLPEKDLIYKPDYVK